MTSTLGRRAAAVLRPHRPVQVLHVITTLTTGGAERQLELVTARTRHSSAVVTLYAGGPVADAIRAGGVEVTELRATGWRKPFAPLLLARHIRRLRPDVVHVHLLSAQVIGIPAARLARVPVVVSTEHSLMADTLEGRPLTWWLRLLYLAVERLATHTVAVSAATADRLHRWGVRPDRVAVTRLGVDLDALAFDDAARDGLRAELGVGPDTRVVGAVGRLAPVKRLDVVLRALAPLLRDGADGADGAGGAGAGTVLVVAGDGPLAADLRALADRLGVAHAVRWLGPREQMGPVLAAMDVLVSASADETFGMAVVEALGTGLPVVYAECPALDELPEVPELAHRVPPSGDDELDAERLRAAVTAALASSPAHGRAGAPTSVSRTYGAREAAARLDDLYERLLARRRG
ncbi:glycosyltransferase [Nocardioides marinquilinus]|uniref:Glycosyltransferase n=1 Tax=Nocardioides marinquilinus TaxID=1210400 RepID=A0ABP9P678_9ACTN